MLGAGVLASGTLSTGVLVAGMLSADALAVGTLVAGTLSTGVLTVGTLSTGVLAVGSLVAGALAVDGVLTTGVFAADSLTAGVLDANVLIAPPSPIVVEPVGLWLSIGFVKSGFGVSIFGVAIAIKSFSYWSTTLACSSDVAAPSIAFSAFVVNSFTFVIACSFCSGVKELSLISFNLICLCESNASLLSWVASFGTTILSFFSSSCFSPSFEELFVEGAISLFSTESFEGVFVVGCSICLSSFSSVWFEGVDSFASVSTGVSAGFTTVAGSWSLFISVCFSTVVLSSTFVAGAEFSAFPSDSVTDVGDTGASSEVGFPLEVLSVDEVTSLLSTFSSLVSLATVPSVCFFSSTRFKGVDSFISAPTDVSADFSTVDAWSVFVSVFFSTVVLSSLFVAGTEFSTFSSDFSAGVGEVWTSSEVVVAVVDFSVVEVVSFFSTSPSVAFLATVPFVCFFSSTGFEEADSFTSVVTDTSTGFTTAVAWSTFFASTFPVVKVWSTFAVSALLIVTVFSAGWLDTKVWLTFDASSLVVTSNTWPVFGTVFSSLVVGFTSVTTVSVFPDCVSSFVVTSKAFTSSFLFWRFTTVTVCFETVWFPVVVEIGCVKPSSLCAYIKLTLVIWFICAKVSIEIPVASLITLNVSPHFIT